MDGKHDGWVTTVALASDVTSRLPLDEAISDKTAEDWLRKEKDVSDTFDKALVHADAAVEVVKLLPFKL